MTGRIPKHFINDLLTRVDIVDLIDRYVPLKKTGANYVARCPFHSEKSPSFSVNRNKQFFHCFGCGASGNAIGFLMDFSNLDFVEAVEDLATFAGIEVPRESLFFTKTVSQKEAISSHYQLLEKAATIYVKHLRSKEAGKIAVNYLKSRGISDDIAGKFMLGYAPEEWRTLTNQFDHDLLVQAGMAINNEGKTYDRFRGRLMFPIRDKRERIIGFGGRVLNDSTPKYLNSPETPIFHKGHEVYGLYELLKSNPKPARILVVEGYMDVIALACHDINYAVATLGTSTSQVHMDLLFRFSLELVFCFDGDTAGQKAAWRAISSVFPALKDGRQIRIMMLPENHDPDSLVRKEGSEKFAERIQNSQALSEYFFGHLAKDLKLAEFENRSSLRAEAESYLTQLPIGAFRELMFDQLSQLYKKHISDQQAILVYNQQVKQHRHKTDRLSLPSFVMAMLIQNPGLVEIIEQQSIDWDFLEFEGISKFKDILAMLFTEKPANYGALLELYRGHPDETIIKKLASVDLLMPEKGLKLEFSDALNRLLAQACAVRLDKLLIKEKNVGLDTSEKNLLCKLLSQKHVG